MKKFLKWTLFILAVAAAVAAGMYYLAQYPDFEEASFRQKPMNKAGRAVAKSLNRHYTKLTLS